MRRELLLAALADRIGSIERPHPVRVAIDGVDAAGKSTLADEIAGVLRACGRIVIRASIDGFHRPEAERYARGSLSPEGYFFDSFDHESLARTLLDPLGQNGSLRYRLAVFDFRRNQPVSSETLRATNDAVLLFDGVFLLRPELQKHWDLTIYVEAAFETTLARACVRDENLFGGEANVRERYMRKYIPGQRLYLEACRPTDNADLVIGNDDPENAFLRDGAGRLSD